MAEYLLQDKDKAAFINRMNKVLSQIGSGFGLDQSSFVDVPETEDDDKCIYIASTDVEEKVLDSLIDKNAFTYKVKKISVNEILREIKRYLKEDTSIIDNLLASGDLTAPTGEGYGMQKSHYILKNGSDLLMFKYNEDSSEPFKVARVFGSSLDKKLLNNLGFEEKFSKVASKNLFEPPLGSESVNLTAEDFKLLLADFKQGFQAYAKSFSDFYKDRRPD